jgi:signal transduction histidine kinase
MMTDSKKQLILIVDDLKDNILILAKILQSDYQVIFATDGKTALTIAEEQLPDIILLDVMMPEMDGYEVCSRLKSNPKTNQIPVIFVTAKADASDELRGLEFGAVDYITKPLHPKIVRLRVGVHLDINQHKRNEEKLLKEKMQAEAFSRAKTEFLSRMSHELRTPMNAVLGFAQLLEMDDLTADQKENVSEIINAGQHLLNLINEILELAAIESGKLDLHITEFELNQSVKHSISLTKLSAAKRGIEIIDNITPHQSLKLIADNMRFKQVLLNLMSNAIKYNQTNGQVILDYELIAEQQRVKINVADTGKGLSPEQMGLLFNSFERLGVKSEEVQGTGIGLCITKQLVEAMHGELIVKSKVGEGSCFSVILPYLAETA